MARALAACAVGVALQSVGSVRVGRDRQAAQTQSPGWEAKLYDGQINLTRPAFMFKDGNDVLITQFGKRAKPDGFDINPFPAESCISKLDATDLGNKMRANDFNGDYDDKVWIGEGPLKWPNQLSKTPAEIGNYVVIPDGFLPPGKARGNIFLADEAGTLNQITDDVVGAFYHLAEWFDFNGDGNLDCMTVRVIKSGWFSFTFEGELLWYENPGADLLLSQKWKSHKIADGPDVYFKTRMYQGNIAVFATEFFNDVPKLSLQFVNMRGELVSSRVIDDNMGNPFGVELVDLDGDGKEDLLATNHQDDEDAIKMGVFAYEIPDDLANGDFIRHTVAYNVSNIKMVIPGVGAPGFAHGFYPREGMTGPKHVITAGDGSFDVWYSRPVGRFQYDTQIIDIGGTTGELLHYDFTGDGVLDVLIPDNDYWKLKALTFVEI